MIEKFREIDALATKQVTAFVGGFSGELVIDRQGLLTVPEARALRDWLNLALPLETGAKNILMRLETQIGLLSIRESRKLCAIIGRLEAWQNS